jgi:UDP-N-acetylglucosamine--N-acetylmuramyl-(pentapeptide) pyrophosphoryl-undecaprenol N-acetylglucosamine transferase
MPSARTFIMAGGGTGGHVIPALAVARELAARGHTPVFIGTETGFEAKLVPASGFTIEYIQIGGLKRVGAGQKIRTLGQLPLSAAKVFRMLDRYRPAAIFSMGGYVAGPVVLAGLARRLPIVVMEPNAVPGFTTRRIGRFVARALLNFEEAGRYFPKGRWELTGVPIRREFFELPSKPREPVFTILVTGGSQGSRTLNEAARGAWTYFRGASFQVRLLHQTGVHVYQNIAQEFAQTGLEGEVIPFIQDMPAAFARADLIVCRSGASAIAEVAAAGKPSILVPFPFAADQHQLHNAEAFDRAGAATLVLDRDMNGQRLFDEVSKLASDSERLASMGQRARAFAHPDAARRAAEILEQLTYANI